MEGKRHTCDCGEKPNTRVTSDLVKIKSATMTFVAEWEPVDPENPEHVAMAEARNKTEPAKYVLAPGFHMSLWRGVGTVRDKNGEAVELVPSDESQIIIHGTVRPGVPE